MTKERFSISKLLDFSPIGFYKVIGLSIKAGIIILICMGVLWVKNLIFPPSPANINQPNISVASGGNLTYQNVQQSDKKKQWWMPSPFVDIFGEKKGSNEDIELGLRTGLHWEF